MASPPRPTATITIRRFIPAVPGDPIDQDCDGRPKPFPPIGAGVTLFWSYTTGQPFYTRITSASVRAAPAGSMITLRCMGRGCPFKKKTLSARRARRRVALTKLFQHSKLRPGTRVTIGVTKPATIGIQAVVKIRRGAPHRMDLCLPPRGRPVPC
jgi:hypothetical protein